jgi:radical SAM protein with 4Fe4S-binding SPASM domain
VCLIDPVGDVYACPLAIDDEFLAGNVGTAGGFENVWRASPLFAARLVVANRLHVPRSITCVCARSRARA